MSAYEKLQPELDKNIKMLLDEAIDSFEKWDILVFFSKNPVICALPEEVARSIGRDPLAIEGELEELANIGILKKATRGGDLCFHFQPAERWKEKIDAFLSALQDKTKRMIILAYLLKGMEKGAGGRKE